MDLDEFKSIAIPVGTSASTCGYCSPPGQRSTESTNFRSTALEAIRISCTVYQGMIDRGWRRSGTYCYKPDLRRSCCPQYTIKLDALAFSPSRSHRKLIYRWNRFIIDDGTNEDSEMGSAGTKKSHVPKAMHQPPLSLSALVHASELEFCSGESPSHTFEVTLEDSSYTPEKFALYEKYQNDIHNDTKNSPKGFKRFLVDSPLISEPIPYLKPPPKHLPLNYGSYHQLYKIDGELVAMAVLDILPSCVSSVYFMYDKSWERFSLGKLSALREVSLAREINELGIHEMQSLYMGFYIYSCQKMRYKGEYSPSYLADPETYEWFHLEECVQLLQNFRYACFSKPEHCIDSEASDSPPEDQELDIKELTDVHVLIRPADGDLIATPISETSYWQYKQVRREFSSCIRGLGMRLTRAVAFAV